MALSLAEKLALSDEEFEALVASEEMSAAELAAFLAEAAKALGPGWSFE